MLNTCKNLFKKTVKIVRFLQVINRKPKNPQKTTKEPRFNISPSRTAPVREGVNSGFWTQNPHGRSFGRSVGRSVL